MIQFPPAVLSDFVIHYRNADFRVHKFVLCYHSAYFRTFIEPLASGQRAYSADECSDHPDIAHCIRLPDTCGKLAASVDDFRVFLAHLYFARRYSCFPFRAVGKLHLSAQPEPAACLDCPGFTTWPQLLRATSSVFSTSSRPSTCTAVSSLCHYFDCAVLLARAETNLLLAVAENQRTRHQEPHWFRTRGYLCFASQFGLQRVKAACIPLQAERCFRLRKKSDSESKEQWEELVRRLDKDTLIELMQAICMLPKLCCC